MNTEKGLTYAQQIRGKIQDIKQQIEPRYFAAKEWTINSLYAIGVTAQAWIKAVNNSPLFIELKDAAKETLSNPAVQDFIAEKAGQLVSHNPDLVNATLNASASVNEIKPHLQNPAVQTFVEQMKKKPEGKKFHKKVSRASHLVNIFSDSMRINRLQTESGS